MRAGVWLVTAAAVALLGIMFLRAFPAAIERQRIGREAALKAVCEPALKPDRENPVLGQIGEGDAPDFTLRDYAGRSVALSSLKGKVVLVNFWATWCNTCDVEMPSLEKLAADESGKDFVLLAVSVDENWDLVRKYFAQGTRMTVLLDADRAVPRRFGTDKFPESFLIDRDGKLRYYVISDRNWSAPDVEGCIDQLISG